MMKGLIKTGSMIYEGRALTKVKDIRTKTGRTIPEAVQYVPVF